MRQSQWLWGWPHAVLRHIRYFDISHYPNPSRVLVYSVSPFTILSGVFPGCCVSFSITLDQTSSPSLAHENIVWGVPKVILKSAHRGLPHDCYPQSRKKKEGLDQSGVDKSKLAVTLSFIFLKVLINCHRTKAKHLFCCKTPKYFRSQN